MRTRATISKRGTVTIPAAIRALFNLTTKHELLVEVTEEGILLRLMGSPEQRAVGNFANRLFRPRR